MFILRLMVVLSVVFSLAACSATTQVTNPDLDARAAQLDKKAAALKQQEMDLKQQEKMAMDKMSAATTAEARAKAAAAAQSNNQQGVVPPASDATYSLFPPNAVSGSCYARLFVPNTYKTATETVLKREAGERIELIPAKYKTASEKVLVKEASQRLEVVPAEYGYVDEKILVTPAKKRFVSVPETYETITEKVMVQAAHSEWKRGTGPIQRIDASTGEIMCLVEEPAIYKNVTKRVLKTKATTKEVETPAVYKTVKKRVMSKKPATRTVEIPAEYKTITVTQLVSPPQEKRIAIPAEYQKVTKKMVDVTSHMEWREILCETNMTRSTISKVQSALKAKGFNPGPIDGAVGSQTMKAANAFQKSKKLLVTEYLTINTLKALGL